MRGPSSPGIKMRKSQNQHKWGPPKRSFVGEMALVEAPGPGQEGGDPQELASSSGETPSLEEVQYSREAAQPGN